MTVKPKILILDAVHTGVHFRSYFLCDTSNVESILTDIVAGMVDENTQQTQSSVDVVPGYVKAIEVRNVKKYFFRPIWDSIWDLETHNLFYIVCNDANQSQDIFYYTDRQVFLQTYMGFYMGSRNT
jgi:hypothetical protein